MGRVDNGLLALTELLSSCDCAVFFFNIHIYIQSSDTRATSCSLVRIEKHEGIRWRKETQGS